MMARGNLLCPSLTVRILHIQTLIPSKRSSGSRIITEETPTYLWASFTASCARIRRTVVIPDRFTVCSFASDSGRKSSPPRRSLSIPANTKHRPHSFFFSLSNIKRNAFLIAKHIYIKFLFTNGIKRCNYSFYFSVSHFYLSFIFNMCTKKCPPPITFGTGNVNTFTKQNQCFACAPPLV